MSGSRFTRLRAPWWIGAPLGGAIGAVAFGLVMVVTSPEFLFSIIPALYGLEPTIVGGSLLHVFHGTVLGFVFGAGMRPESIRYYIETDVETPFLARLSPNSRIVLAGLLFGLAVWATLPLIVMPAWLGTVGYEGGSSLSELAIDGIFGHMVYGVVLGAVYDATVERT